MLSFVDEEAWEETFLLSSVSNGFSGSSNVSMSLFVFQRLRLESLGSRRLRKGCQLDERYWVIEALVLT